jgi:uncharacterized protein
VNPMVSLRTCIGCRKKAPRPELVRLVRLGDGRVALDAERRRRGRGASVCKTERCVRAGARAGGRPWRAAVVYDADALWRDLQGRR